MARLTTGAFTDRMTEPTHYKLALDEVAKAVATASSASRRGAGVTTYGLGMSLLTLIRDPLHAGGSVELVAEGTGSPR